MEAAVHAQPGEEIRVLVVVEEPQLRQEVCLRLAEPSVGFNPLPAATLAEALPYLEARQADAVVGDLAALVALRGAKAAAYAEAGWAPFCVLVPPGREEQAALLLDSRVAECVLQTGNYHRLLPPLLRRSLRRQETSREEVARVIRHEMNNPLTGVLGNAELILAEGPTLPEKVRERLGTIIHLTVRLRDVVKNLEQRLREGESQPKGSRSAESAPPLELSPEIFR